MRQERINKYTHLTAREHIELYKNKEESEKQDKFVEKLQNDCIIALSRLKQTEFKVVIRDSEIRELKAKLASNAEFIEMLEEKTLQFEENKDIPVRLVKFHEIKKRKK